MTSTATRTEAKGPAPLPLDFAELFETYFDFVWANVRRLGVARDQVDDAVQDVFLAVHRRLPEFEGRASVKTWLFHFILRVASGYRRAARPVHRPALPEPTSTTPELAVESRQATELMYQLLDELSDERRAVFVLVELEEQSIPEVARLLELNVNTAYSRLREARRDFEQAVTRARAREDWRTR